MLDFILKREGFAQGSAIIFDLGERKKLHLTLSSLSINNVDYVVSKIESRQKSRRVIINLLSLVEILPVSKSTVEKAALSKFKDFEDALQNFCSAEGSVNHLITRNIKDYKESNLSIQTPKEVLASFTLTEDDHRG